MAKKNSKAPKKAMIFNSVIMINTENVVSLVNSLPKTKMSESAFNSFMENTFTFGGKFHGQDFNGGGHYSTVVRQLGLYHIFNNEYIPRFYSNINQQIAESYLRYWLRLYVVPNPTSQPSFRKSFGTPKYLLKELIQFIESNPNKKNIYDIVDQIFGQALSRNDKGNLPIIINKYSDCISVNNNDVSLKLNYKEVMAEINSLIDNPNRFFEHFGKGDEAPKSSFNDNPLQQIFYGAPGTGKSHKIKKDTKGEDVIRTTFHPDSDYSTFVGAYKPVMDNVDVHAAPVVVENGISIKPIGTYKEQRISYRFVKQAFLKSYLAAWKRYSEGKTHSVTKTIKGPITFETDHNYTIISVDDEGLMLSRESNITKKSVSSEWQNLWPQGSFKLPQGEQSGRSEEQAIATWINDNIENCSEDDFEQGWEALLEKIKNEGSVTVKRKKEYIVSAIKDETEILRIKAGEAGKKRKQLQKVYSSSSNIQLENKLIEILKELNNSDFDNAWEKLKQAVTNGTTLTQVKTYKPQFLIIEEINRGNCAQIFGDLFQLLDRSDNGFSTYPIDADTDIQREIERAFVDEDQYKIENLEIEENAVEDYVSNYGHSLEDDILHGRVLLLPPNLYIWATMNTSDQSLFPIDSAFKRRWDWKYIKITEGKDKGGNALNWKIKTGAEHDWWEFVQQINRIIYSMTSSADKQLGFYFCQATNNEINAETFVNKVAFYLWNDVFKDFAEEESDLFKFKKNENDKEDSDLTFPDFFNDEGQVIEAVAQRFIENVMKWNTDEKKEKKDKEDKEED